MNLTDKAIKGLKPRAGRYSIGDTGSGGQRGLYVLVTPGGRKTFYARLRVDGVHAVHTFTPDFPQLGLAAAREALIDHRRDRRRRATALASDTTRLTCLDAFEEWMRLFITPYRKNPEQVRRAMEADVLPHLGPMLVRDVTLRDLTVIVDKVFERGSVRMADQIRSLLLQWFKFLAGRGVRPDSPATLLPKRQRGRHAGQRERVLNDDEIRALWAATADERDEVPEAYHDRYLARVSPYTKRVLRLLLLTGMRRSEAVDAEWSEIDLDAGTWTLPKERTKSGRANVVPLSDPAVEVLDAQLKLTQGCTHVFASPRSAFKKPILASAVSQAVNDNFAQILGIKKRARRESIEAFNKRTADVAFTPHDLRRTLRSRLAGLGVSSVVARKVIGHRLEGMDAIYDRHPYTAEKRDALERWANELRAILAGERKVVPMPQRRRARA